MRKKNCIDLSSELDIAEEMKKAGQAISTQNLELVSSSSSSSSSSLSFSSGYELVASGVKNGQEGVYPSPCPIKEWTRACQPGGQIV